jgi:hypothetical protein
MSINTKTGSEQKSVCKWQRPRQRSDVAPRVLQNCDHFSACSFLYLSFPTFHTSGVTPALLGPFGVPLEARSSRRVTPPSCLCALQTHKPRAVCCLALAVLRLLF